MTAHAAWPLPFSLSGTTRDTLVLDQSDATHLVLPRDTRSLPLFAFFILPSAVTSSGKLFRKVLRHWSIPLYSALRRNSHACCSLNMPALVPVDDIKSAGSICNVKPCVRLFIVGMLRLTSVAELLCASCIPCRASTVQSASPRRVISITHQLRIILPHLPSLFSVFFPASTLRIDTHTVPRHEAHPGADGRRAGATAHRSLGCHQWVQCKTLATHLLYTLFCTVIKKESSLGVLPGSLENPIPIDPWRGGTGGTGTPFPAPLAFLSVYTTHFPRQEAGPAPLIGTRRIGARAPFPDDIFRGLIFIA